MKKARFHSSAVLLWRGILPAVLFAVLFFEARLYAQSADAGNTSTTESLGLGVTRFNSGYSPITLDRPGIRPGQPFNIRPTMDSLVAGSSGGSFGGLLNRYDMSGFGRIFASRRAVAALAAELTRNLPPPADTTVVNTTDIPHMYPPRLKTDPTDFPLADLNSAEKREEIDLAVRAILERYPLDRRDSIQIDIDGDRLILSGQIGSQQTIDALALGVGLIPGVFGVDNQIQCVPSDTQRPKDVLGYEQ